MKLQNLIEKHWYYKNNPLLALFLLPLALLFFFISKTRYFLYKAKILKSFKLPVPVVIVGNISVGGAGKTPLTKYLAEELSQSGISVGVILRGYKSSVKGSKVVLADDSSALVGDEALIYARNNIRVAIGSSRYHAGLALLAAYPDIQLILTDDGLQHYRLQRDYEIAVIDSSRMLGNCFTLPMGPLRENTARLKTVDAVVINGKTPENLRQKLAMPKLVVEQKLVLDKILNPKKDMGCDVKEFNNKKIVAIAAIGNPQRFFDFIFGLGINLNNVIAFPDHHHYVQNDIPQGYDIILTTEKDYAKISEFNLENIRIVLVKTKLDNPELLNQIRKLVKS